MMPEVVYLQHTHMVDMTPLQLFRMACILCFWSFRHRVETRLRKVNQIEEAERQAVFNDVRCALMCSNQLAEITPGQFSFSR